MHCRIVLFDLLDFFLCIAHAKSRFDLIEECGNSNMQKIAICRKLKS